jgi:protein-S-isoprenylcysteine O-methyltransferase Ste14
MQTESMTAARVSQVALGVVVVSACAWWLASVLEWSALWFYVVLLLLTFAVNGICLKRWNPVLIGRRVGLGGPKTKTWDLALLVVLLAPAIIAIFVVADRAHDGASLEPGVAWLAGLLVHIASWSLVTWGMVVNPFFEKTVRIQTDNDHQVVDRGPYAYVRHPGYVGFIGWMISAPLLLDSTLAFIPGGVAAAVFVLRTALEDRTLQRELDGYAAYASRVRYRLIPGLW